MAVGSTNNPTGGQNPAGNIAQALGLAVDPGATAVEVPQSPGAAQSQFSPGDPHATSLAFNPQAIQQNILAYTEKFFPSLLGVMRTMFSAIGLHETTLGEGWTRYPLTQDDIRQSIRNLRAELEVTGEDRIRQDMRIRFADPNQPSNIPEVNYDYIEARINSEIARLTAVLNSGAEVAGSLMDVELGAREAYFFGDIHENLEGLNKILNTPDASGKTLMQKMAANEAVVVLGGDIIHTATGTESDMPTAQAVIDRVVRLQERFPNNFFVTDGNHHIVFGQYEDLVGKRANNGGFLPQGGSFRDEIIGERGISYARTLQGYFDRLPKMIRIMQGGKVLGLLGHVPVLFGYRDLSPAQLIAAHFDPHMRQQLRWNRPVIPGEDGGNYRASDVVRMQNTIGSGPETAILGAHQYNPDMMSSDFRPFSEVPNFILFQATEDFGEIRCAVIKSDGSVEVRSLAEVKGPASFWVDAYGVQPAHVQAPAATASALPAGRSAPQAAPAQPAAQPAAAQPVTLAQSTQPQSSVDSGVVMIPQSNGNITVRTVMPGGATIFTMPDSGNVTFGANNEIRLLKGADGKIHVQTSVGSAELTARGVQVGEFMVSAQGGSDVMIMRLRTPGNGAGAVAHYAGLPPVSEMAASWREALSIISRSSIGNAVRTVGKALSGLRAFGAGLAVMTPLNHLLVSTGLAEEPVAAPVLGMGVFYSGHVPMYAISNGLSLSEAATSSASLLEFWRMAGRFQVIAPFVHDGLSSAGFSRSALPDAWYGGVAYEAVNIGTLMTADAAVTSGAATFGGLLEGLGVTGAKTAAATALEVLSVYGWVLFGIQVLSEMQALITPNAIGQEKTIRIVSYLSGAGDCSVDGSDESLRPCLDDYWEARYYVNNVSEDFGRNGPERVQQAEEAVHAEMNNEAGERADALRSAFAGLLVQRLALETYDYDGSTPPQSVDESMQSIIADILTTSIPEKPVEPQYPTVCNGLDDDCDSNFDDPTDFEALPAYEAAMEKYESNMAHYEANYDRMHGNYELLKGILQNGDNKDKNLEEIREVFIDKMNLSISEGRSQFNEALNLLMHEELNMLVSASTPFGGEAVFPEFGVVMDEYNNYGATSEEVAYAVSGLIMNEQVGNVTVAQVSGQLDAMRENEHQTYEAIQAAHLDPFNIIPWLFMV